MISDDKDIFVNKVYRKMFKMSSIVALRITFKCKNNQKEKNSLSLFTHKDHHVNHNLILFNPVYHSTL